MKAKMMGKTSITLFLMLIVSLFMTSCSGIVTPGLQLNLNQTVNKIETIDSVYLDVPYEKYAGTNWCLPASAAMTLKYFGKSISQAEIASAVITNGTSSVFKFISFANNLGFNSKYLSKTIEEIKVLLEENTPVIAVQNYSLALPYSHARVIIGFDDLTQQVITNDPTAGKDYKISYADFISLSPNGKPNECKVIVLSTGGIDTKNIIAENNINNS